MAKLETAVPPTSLRSAADLSAKEFFLGKIGAGGVALCSVLGEAVDGVIGGYQTNKGGSGDPVDFYMSRTAQAFCVTASNIADGAELTTDAAGKAKTAVSGNTVFGKAQQAVDGTAADAFVDFVFVPRYVKP